MSTCSNNRDTANHLALADSAPLGGTAECGAPKYLTRQPFSAGAHSVMSLAYAPIAENCSS